MKIIKKIGIFILVVCVLLTSNLSNSNATNIKPDAKFITQKIYKELYYNSEKVEVPITIKKVGEQEIPIYNIKMNNMENIFIENPEKEYVLNKEEVRAILILGYPNTSIDRLNCNNKEEAYIVTQIAIWNLYYKYDLKKFSLTDSNKYSDIIQKVEKLVEKAKKGVKAKENTKYWLEEETTMWEENEDTYSNRYRIGNYVDFEKYEVELSKKNNENIRIENENGEMQKEFLQKEKFKVYYPKRENVIFELKVKITFETQPVKAGKRPDKNEEYYVYLDKNEEVEEKFIRYYKNGKDPELEQPIEPELGEEEPTDPKPTAPEQGEKEPTDPKPTTPEQGEKEPMDPKPTAPEQGEKEPTDPKPTTPETEEKDPMDSEQSIPDKEDKKPIAPKPTTPEQGENESVNFEPIESEPKESIDYKGKEPEHKVQEEEKTKPNETELKNPEKLEKTETMLNKKETEKNKEIKKNNKKKSKINANKKLPRTGC